MCFKTGTYYIPADCSEHSDTPSLKSENHYTLLLRKIKKEAETYCFRFFLLIIRIRN